MKIRLTHLKNSNTIQNIRNSSSTSTKYISKSMLQNNIFIKNTASESGGGIRFNLYPPELSNNIFTNNTAQYGQNIASYVVKAISLNHTGDQIKLENVGSGQSLSTPLYLAIVDNEGKIMVLDNTSQITIKSKYDNSSLIGTHSQKVTAGVAVFNDLILISAPGQTNIEYDISVSSVNKNIVKLAYGSNYTQNPLVVNFRYCQPGEYLNGNICSVCSPGTYSLSWSSTKCTTCIPNAVCLGGKQIYVQSGYWRTDANSTSVQQCIRETSCLGGYVENAEHPVN